ncbi:MAG TPA: M28 family peptidase, partial [Allosphingosinicella sp.]|nr:M28 family peptidase [Allosphingosinicella sp.]
TLTSHRFTVGPSSPAKSGRGVRTGIAAFLLLFAAPAAAQKSAPLLTQAETEALASELSGASAKRTVQALSLHHRMRGSEGYRAAAELIRDRLQGHGLKEVEILSLPADGKIFYGTQRSRPAWNASFAELWEQRQQGGRWSDSERIASWADQPITLAQDSVGGRAEAELVDVGTGASAADYSGKDVRGKLVLVSGQPEAAAKLAVTERGAAGIISWAQNQRSAWWGEDESLIRWGHLSTWNDPTFAFMVSPARARAWQARLAKGETVRLRAEVKAGRAPGAYLIPTAIIPGRDRSKEILFSCHLDHPSPGANDNASGCSGILEIARTFQRLIAQGRLPQPQRTLRFIWPCEIECTIALLNAKPEFARRTLATIHLDMIGGNTEVTKGTLGVEGSPPSLPSFVSGLAFATARWVDAQASLYAERGEADFPLLDPEGTKIPLRARIGGFSEGSDHQVWSEGSWRIPVIYVSDWPDIYIHTNKDVPGNLDSTKMKRAMFIAAASAWALAGLESSDTGALERLQMMESGFRQHELALRTESLSSEDGVVAVARHSDQEGALEQSLRRFGLSVGDPEPPVIEPVAGGPSGTVYRRDPKLKGPMDGFGYSWLDDHLEKAKLPRPALLSREPSWEGPSFGYEALNLVDGRRTVRQIRDELAVTVGPAPVEEVAAFLATLERLGVIRR